MASPTSPDTVMPLGRREAHIYSAHNDILYDHAEYLLRIASPEEKRTASRMHNAQRGRAFLLRRGALRLLLSYHSDTPPADITYTRGRYGKPALAPHNAPGAATRHRRPHPPAHFSVSYSAEYTLYACARAYPLGVDIEYRYPAHRQLQTVAAWIGLPEGTTDPARILRAWVRCEAVIKCYGGSIMHPPSAMRYTHQTRPTRRLVAPPLAHPRFPSPHYLVDIDAPLGYMAALATRGIARPQCHTHTLHSRDINWLAHRMRG